MEGGLLYWGEREMEMLKLGPVCPISISLILSPER